VRLELEELESRALLSASGVTAATNDTTIAPAASSTFSGYTPQQLQAAYGVPSSVNGKPAGTGETIAIVDAYNDPNIQNDLTVFDGKYFPLQPAANLTVVNQTGGTSLPAANASWAVEESLDVEWAHAIAPGANIVLVEANSNSLSDLLTAVKTAATTMGANVVSMSWGASEFSGETTYDQYFNAPGVTYVASAGDSSAYFGPEWPASSPNVLAVGGTTLKLTSTNQISSETAWNASYVYIPGSGWTIEGGGGGVSSYESEPAFQSGNSVPNFGGRSTPDVSWDANPSTGVSVYDSYLEPGWGYVGGTSAGAPAWSGIVAIADQQSVANGHGSLSTAQVDNALYGVFHSSGGASYTSGTAYTSDFNDITSGSNGYAAAKGYDRATGLGSPKVSALVTLLAGSPASSMVTSGSTTTSGSSPGGSSIAARQHAILGTDEVTGTSGNTIPNVFSVLATNVPFAGSAGSSAAQGSAGSLAAGNSNVSFTFNLTTEGSPASLPTTSVPLASSLNPSVPQNTIVFGASGWSGSGHFRRLSSHDMHGPAAEEMEDYQFDDLVGALEEQADTAVFDESVSSGAETPALDPAARAANDSSAGEGSE
jgi:subtilase family serine protease